MQQSIESYTYQKNPPVDEAGMYIGSAAFIFSLLLPVSDAVWCQKHPHLFVQTLLVKK